GGEIRGQLNLDRGLTFDTWLSGAQEVPSAVTEATGFAAVTLSPTFDEITYRVVTDGLSGNFDAAHFHNAALGTNGGVLLNLSEGIDGNQTVGSSTDVSPELINALLTGNIYINVHTPGFPAGEVRGQLFRLARDGYGYDLCGDQETSAVDAPTATGGGMASIDRNLSNAHVMVVVSGLTGDLTGAHIHQAPAGMDGDVIFNMTDLFSNGGGFTYWSEGFGEETARAIQDGNTYVNIHTDLHPGGEIRGQIIKDLTCPPLVAVVDCEANPIVVEHIVECDEASGLYTVNVTITNGAAPYIITGDLNETIEDNTFTIGPFTDGSTYNFSVQDDNDCTAEVNSEVIACSKFEDCETNPIGVIHEVDCDETSGLYTVNVTITNGTAPYIITGDLNETINESTFSIGPFTDGTTYNFNVEDDNGCTAQVNSEIIACSKEDDCETNPITITAPFLCNEDGEANYMVNVTITNGTAPYNLTGSVAGEFQNDNFQLGPFESGTAYTLNIEDANGCTASFVSDVIDCKPLPVEFLSFEGEVLTEGNQLQWVTASETNNDFFTLERSFDGQSFETIAKVTGVGNSQLPSSYEYLDREPTTAGITYYRLSQTDLDGRSELLATISLQRGESSGFGWIEVKPIPTNDWLNVAFTTSNSQDLSVQILDISGRLLSEQPIESSINQVNTTQIDVRNLQTGIYILRINSEKTSIQHKFIKY
ncbi:MAG: CHRD domain-containing protein, partial [Chitinophagales bacterium]